MARTDFRSSTEKEQHESVLELKALKDTVRELSEKIDKLSIKKHISGKRKRRGNLQNRRRGKAQNKGKVRKKRRYRESGTRRKGIPND